MADKEQQRDPLQSTTGGEPQKMQMGQEPGSQQGQQGQGGGQPDALLSGGGQGQAMPTPGGESAGEMSQTDAGFGSTVAVKQGGLGASQDSYGQSTQQDVTGGLGAQSANIGAQGQTGVLGKSPGHDKDLATGLKDQNQGGGGGGL